MTLPKIQYPIFELTLPSSKKTIKYRPFLVKEEKMFLVAQESNSTNDIINAVKQVIINCCLDNIDIENLPLCDFEYIFIKLRAKSINNIIDVIITDKDDGEQYKAKVDLEQVEPSFNPNYTDKIDLGGGIGIKLKLPKFSTVLKAANITSEAQITIDLLKSCIESIYTADTVHPFNEATQAEQDEFIDSLPTVAWEKVGQYFETMPKIQHNVQYTTKAGAVKTASLEGLMNFFQ